MSKAPKICGGGKRYCVCCSNFSGKEVEGRIVKLHTFPKDRVLRSAWINRLRLILPSFQKKANTRLCSEHFKHKQGPIPGDIVPSVFGKRIFKANTLSGEGEEETARQKDAAASSPDEDEEIIVDEPQASALQGKLPLPYFSLTLHDYSGPVKVPDEKLAQKLVREAEAKAAQTQGPKCITLTSKEVGLLKASGKTANDHLVQVAQLDPVSRQISYISVSLPEQSEGPISRHDPRQQLTRQSSRQTSNKSLVLQDPESADSENPDPQASPSSPAPVHVVVIGRRRKESLLQPSPGECSKKKARQSSTRRNPCAGCRDGAWPSPVAAKKKPWEESDVRATGKIAGLPGEKGRTLCYVVGVEDEEFEDDEDGQCLNLGVQKKPRQDCSSGQDDTQDSQDAAAFPIEVDIDVAEDGSTVPCSQEHAMMQVVPVDMEIGAAADGSSWKCSQEHAMMQALYGQAVVPVEVKMERETEDFPAPYPEERELLQTPSELPPFPVEVKMEPAEGDGNGEHLGEREENETMQEFSVYPVELISVIGEMKREPVTWHLPNAQFYENNACGEEREEYQTTEDFPEVQTKVKTEPLEEDANTQIYESSECGEEREEYQMTEDFPEVQIEVKREPVEEDANTQIYESNECGGEREEYQTREEFPEVQTKVKTEPVEEDANAQYYESSEHYEEREEHGTPDEFSEFQIEVKMEPVEEEDDAQHCEERWGR